MHSAASEDAELLHGQKAASDVSPMGTDEVVAILAARLRKISQAELSTAEKSRFTAALADALLRAINVDVIDKRLESLKAVLGGRNEDKKSKDKRQS